MDLSYEITKPPAGALYPSLASNYYLPMPTRAFLTLLGLSLVAAPFMRAQSPSTIELRPGLVITQSARIAPRVYRLAAPESSDSAVITIRGDDITLDFAGATMEGLPSDSNPDLANGVAVRVDGGRNVRIVNSRIRGYKFGILARRTKSLSLIDNDLT